MLSGTQLGEERVEEEFVADVGLAVSSEEQDFAALMLARVGVGAGRFGCRVTARGRGHLIGLRAGRLSPLAGTPQVGSIVAEVGDAN